MAKWTDQFNQGDLWRMLSDPERTGLGFGGIGFDGESYGWSTGNANDDPSAQNVFGLQYGQLPTAALDLMNKRYDSLMADPTAVYADPVWSTKEAQFKDLGWDPMKIRGAAVNNYMKNLGGLGGMSRPAAWNIYAGAAGDAGYDWRNFGAGMSGLSSENANLREQLEGQRRANADRGWADQVIDTATPLIIGGLGSMFLGPGIGQALGVGNTLGGGLASFITSGGDPTASLKNMLLSSSGIGDMIKEQLGGGSGIGDNSPEFDPTSSMVDLATRTPDAIFNASSDDWNPRAWDDTPASMASADAIAYDLARSGVSNLDALSGLTGDNTHEIINQILNDGGTSNQSLFDNAGNYRFANVDSGLLRDDVFGPWSLTGDTGLQTWLPGAGDFDADSHMNPMMLPEDNVGNGGGFDDHMNSMMHPEGMDQDQIRQALEQYDYPPNVDTSVDDTGGAGGTGGTGGLGEFEGVEQQQAATDDAAQDQIRETLERGDYPPDGGGTGGTGGAGGGFEFPDWFPDTLRPKNLSEWLKLGTVAVGGLGLVGNMVTNARNRNDANARRDQNAANNAARQAQIDHPGTGNYGWSTAGPLTRLSTNPGVNAMYGRGPATAQQRLFYDKVNPYRAAKGGMAPIKMSGLSALMPPGGGKVHGDTPGQGDVVPAILAPGEYVWDADVVAALGDGNTEAGAKVLDAARERIRAHKRSAPKGKIPPKAKPLEKYLGGKV